LNPFLSKFGEFLTYIEICRLVSRLPRKLSLLRRTTVNKRISNTFKALFCCRLTLVAGARHQINETNHQSYLQRHLSLITLLPV